MNTAVPCPKALRSLSEYADVLARFGAGSPEALALYQASQTLPGFAENAHQLERLQEEDLGPCSGFSAKWPPLTYGATTVADAGIVTGSSSGCKQ